MVSTKAKIAASSLNSASSTTSTTGSATTGHMPPSPPPSGSTTTTTAGGHPPPPPPPALPDLSSYTTLNGTSGNDTVTGTSANDHIFGSYGADTIDGGGGANVMDYSKLHAGVTLHAGGTVDKGVYGVDTVSNINTFIGAMGQNNVIDARTPGVNNGTSLTVDLSKHTLSVTNVPGVGSLTFNVYGFSTVYGTNNGNSITGDNCNDTLVGGTGNDTIVAGHGNNTLTGNGGTDVFENTGGHDIITDFSAANGDTVKITGTIHDIADNAGGAIVHLTGGGSVELLGIAASAVQTSWFVHVTS
jgi:Ca2+-binding RTX toxin-like protein